MGLDLTYKELKQVILSDVDSMIEGLDLTYKELKRFPSLAAAKKPVMFRSYL